VAVAVEKTRLEAGGLDCLAATSAVRRLAFSRCVTYAGGSAAFWALSAILYGQTHSAAIVAAAALASFSVPAALSPLAGLLGDHHDRKKVMLASELGGAVCFLALALASGSPVALLVIRVMASVAYAPLVPVTNAALPALVGTDNLDRANVAISKAGIAGALLGPAVAGLMLVTAGAAVVFLLNAVTFLISAAVIFSVNGDFRPSHSRRGELAAGFTFLRNHRLLQHLTTAYGIAFVGIGVSIPAEVVLAADFGAGSLGYAGLVSLWGIGSLVGASLAKHFAADPRRVLLVAIAALMIAIGFLAVSVAPVFAIALIGMAIGGVGEGWWDVTQTTLMQRVTPDGIRARVFAGSQAVMQIGIAIGLLASGLVTATLGASGAFGVAAAGSAIATLVLFLRSLSGEVALRNNNPLKTRVRTLRGNQPAGSSSPLSIELSPTA
jgi:MFS family permease